MAAASNKTLIKAVKRGAVKKIRKALADGADPNGRNKKEQTPLMIACIFCSLEAAQALIEAGARFEGADLEGNSLASVALYSGDPAIISLILDGQDQSGGKVDLTAVSDDGMNLLHFACLGGDLDAVKRTLPLAKGNLDVTTQEGKTPLIFACEGEKCSVELLEFLINAGANINAADKDGTTPLMCMTTVRVRSTEPLKFLIGAGADIHATDSLGKTALHAASWWQSTFPIELHEILLAAGAKIDAVDNEGRTPLHLALYDFRIVAERVAYLLANGASVNARTHEGQTPLMLAATGDSLTDEVLSLLLNAGAELDAVDNQGRPALSIASEKSQAAALKLLKHHPQKLKPDNSGKSPLHYAAEAGHFLLPNFLLEAGAELEAVDAAGHTPLSLACQAGKSKAAEALVQLGANTEKVSAEGLWPVTASKD
jgi:ankyrin repeat protein